MEPAGPLISITLLPEVTPLKFTNLGRPEAEPRLPLPAGPALISIIITTWEDTHTQSLLDGAILETSTHGPKLQKVAKPIQCLKVTPKWQWTLKCWWLQSWPGHWIGSSSHTTLCPAYLLKQCPCSTHQTPFLFKGPTQDLPLWSTQHSLSTYWVAKPHNMVPWGTQFIQGDREKGLWQHVQGIED